MEKLELASHLMGSFCSSRVRVGLGHLDFAAHANVLPGSAFSPPPRRRSVVSSPPLFLYQSNTDASGFIIIDEKDTQHFQKLLVSAIGWKRSHFICWPAFSIRRIVAVPTADALDKSS